MSYKQESIAGRNINNDMQMIPLLMAEIKDKLKRFLMKVKEESEKASLNFSIKKKL